MSASVSPPRWADPLKIIGVAVLYMLLAKATLMYLAGNGVVSIVWPPSGLALAAVLIGGKRYAWSVFLGTLGVNAMVPGNTLSLMVGLASGAALQALVGAWLLTRGDGFYPDFRRLKDFLRLVGLAGFAGVIVGALIGTSTLLFNGFIRADDFPLSLLYWWMGDVLGIILLTPLILVWRRPPDGWLRPGRLLEAILILGLSFLAGQIIFLGWFHELAGPYAESFFMFLFVALAAVRLGMHGTMAVLIMAGIQCILGSIHGLGHFPHDTPDAQLVNYWLYIVTLSVVGITLATFIASEQRDKETLREQEEFFHMITENIDDYIAVLDLEGHRLYNSPSYAKLFGNPKNLLNSDSFAEIHPDDREHVMQVFRETVQSGVGQRIDFRFVLPDGSVRSMESRGGIIRNSLGKPMHVVVVSHDITERKRIEETIRNLAFYDALTQLPNRRMLNDRLGQAMAASKRSGQYGALLFLDLDNFKPLNDHYGHNAGDLLLIEVAQRLSGCVRQIDTVARFGGDEFVVMLGALDADKMESLRQAEIVAEKIRVALAQPYLITFSPEDGSEITVNHRCTSSIGAVLFFDHEASQEDIIKWADTAMYRAKEDGRNLIRFHI